MQPFPTAGAGVCQGWSLPVDAHPAGLAGTWELGTEAAGTPKLKRSEVCVRHAARGGASCLERSGPSDLAPLCSLLGTGLCQPNVPSARGWRRWVGAVELALGTPVEHAQPSLGCSHPVLWPGG